MACSILIAEDDAEMRQLLAASLRIPGYQVVLLEDGTRLRDYLRSHGDEEPALIISDIQMPGWTGFNVLQFVRRTLPNTPVVLITAFGDPQTHHRARELGAAAIFDKPFDLLQLRRVAHGLLDGHGHGH